MITKKYIYNWDLVKYNQKGLWGETIKRVALFFVLAMALAALAAPVMAQGAMVGNGGVDILGQGIFETEGSAFKFPAAANTNYDSIKVVGQDRAQAIGAGAGWGIGLAAGNIGAVSALNDLEIKKNQDTGDSGTCASCSPKYNVEQIEVGSRFAQAIGAWAGPGIGIAAGNAGGISAVNRVKIVTNQQ
jgi:hypothetical protein